MKYLPLALIASLGFLGCYGKSAGAAAFAGGSDPRAASEVQPFRKAAEGCAGRDSARFGLLAMVDAWRGSDPAALGRNMKEIQAVRWKGGQYFLIAIPGRLDVAGDIDGRQVLASLRFDPATRSWRAEGGTERTAAAGSPKAPGGPSLVSGSAQRMPPLP